MTNKELKTLRLALCLTQKGMAERLGIGYRMYHYVENGDKKLSKASSMLAQYLQKELEASLTLS